MSDRLPIGYNPDTGVAKYWHDAAGGDWAQESVQDCTDILEHNKVLSNHKSTYLPDGEGQLQARIPFIIIDKWRHDYGIDYFNPDHDDAVERLLDSSEWRYLRVDGVKNSNVSMSGITIGAGSPIFDPPQRDANAILASDGLPMRTS